MAKVTFTLNDETVTVDEPLNMRFLDILRKELGLTGSKEGCGEGECGACSVFMDGWLVNSCLLPLASVEGRDIMTIEGYRETKRYKVLENAFVEEGAVQCGICTPGMVMAAENLLNRNPSPSEEEIRIALAGNLCRCTGYEMIFKAVKRASKEGEGLW